MNILLDIFLTFARIGVFTFGGGYAMIPLLDNECVEKKRWLTSDEFMNLTVIAESTPGPIAINCATYVGYKKAKIPGAVLATLGVVLPSFIIILIISYFLEDLLKYEIVSNAFKGIRIAVALLIINAGVKMVSKMIKKKDNRTLSIIFTALFFGVMFVLNLLGIKFSIIYLIFIAGVIGFFAFHVFRRKGVEK